MLPSIILQKQNGNEDTNFPALKSLILVYDL